MKTALLTLLLSSTLLPAGTLIFGDNFNAPNTDNFDASNQSGRRSGILGGTAQLRSSPDAQHSIMGNQLNFKRADDGVGRIRLQPTPSTWVNFAADLTGTTILAEKGLRISFDWSPADADTANSDWISLNTGTATKATSPPESGTSVNDSGTDFGILFRNNGGTQYFKNGVGTDGTSFTITPLSTHKVVITLAFTSFADASEVTAGATVDGTNILPSDTKFNWNGNNGVQNLEIGNLALNTRLDNLRIEGLSTSDSDNDGLPDEWELRFAANLTDLKGLNPSGTGPGSGNFDNDTLTDFQEYQLSINDYPNISPVLLDTDIDGLEDGLEITPVSPRLATNPTLADTDNDGLSDLVENNTAIFASATNTGSSPLNGDTDNDNFPDGYEVNRSSSPVNAAQLPTLPAPLTTSILTTDAASGINSSKTYSHAISGGSGATINGVTFSSLTAPLSVAGFTWAALPETNPGLDFNSLSNPELGDWKPTDGNVPDGGVQTLLVGFTYSSTGANFGASQTYTLSGLTPGQKYETRLFVRIWSKAASSSTRPHSLTFGNGAQSLNAYVLEDRPDIMLGNTNKDSAYTLNFPYTAQATTLTITAAVPFNAIPDSGSWHLYGLSNEIVGPIVSNFEITSLSYQPSPPSFKLSFNSVPGAKYIVDSSTSLTAAGQPGGWTTRATDLASQGNQTTYTDTTAAGTGPRVFYRVRLKE